MKLEFYQKLWTDLMIQKISESVVYSFEETKAVYMVTGKLYLTYKIILFSAESGIHPRLFINCFTINPFARELLIDSFKDSSLEVSEYNKNLNDQYIKGCQICGVIIKNKWSTCNTFNNFNLFGG